MYKKANDNAQRKASLFFLSELARDCDVVLTPAQERENLVAQLRAIEKQLSELPKGEKYRAELGTKKLELQNKINAIRPKLKAPIGVPECFIDLCREQLPAAQFKRLMHEASNKAKERLSAEQSAACPIPAGDS